MSLNAKGRVYCDFCGRLASTDCGDYFVRDGKVISLNAVVENGRQTSRDICALCAEQHPEIEC